MVLKGRESKNFFIFNRLKWFVTISYENEINELLFDDSGGYMLLHTPKGKDVTIDFQFVAPQSASQDMFNKDKSASEKVRIFCLILK